MLSVKSEESIINKWTHTDLTYVSIICPVFNQEKYIRSALDGFLEQECDYKFEIIVHDDCSTDDTINILLDYRDRYPNIIKLKLQNENQYSQGNKIIPIALKECIGKYIAFCDGDDYWIDKNKIQQQIIALEKNSSYVLSYSKANAVSPNGKLRNAFGASYIDDFNYVKNMIPTLTVLIRKEICDNFFSRFRSELKDWKMSDYPLWLFARNHGDFHFINRVTSAYRVFQVSVSRSVNHNDILSYRFSSFRIAKYFISCNSNGAVKKKCLYTILFIYMTAWSFKKSNYSFLKLKEILSMYTD